MSASLISQPSRRLFLTGVLASGAMLLPACQATADFVVTAVTRRLMKKSAENAIANMMAPNGAWDQEIRTAGLKEGVGLQGQMLAAALTSEPLKQKAEHAFVDIAKGATDVAAPVIADAIRKIGLRNAAQLAKAGPEAATQALRAQIETSIATSTVGHVVNAMRSQESERLREVLQGVDQDQLQAAGTQIANRIESVFWREMGKAEAEIRANPEATGDAELIKFLRGGS